MCDPDITLEQLHNPRLFIQLTPNSKFINSETLYLAIDDKNPIHCERVLNNDENFIEFTNEDGQGVAQQRKYLKRSIGKGKGKLNLYRKDLYRPREEYLKLIEGTEPTDYDRTNKNRKIERYLRGEDNMREISQYLGGKKYKRKTKRTNKKRTNRTKRTKRTKRRQTRTRR